MCVISHTQRARGRREIFRTRESCCYQTSSRPWPLPWPASRLEGGRSSGSLNSVDEHSILLSRTPFHQSISFHLYLPLNGRMSKSVEKASKCRKPTHKSVFRFILCSRKPGLFNAQRHVMWDIGVSNQRHREQKKPIDV